MKNNFYRENRSTKLGDKKMEFKKITEGCVEQTFEDDKCVSQKFVAGDVAEYINDQDKVLDSNFVRDHIGTTYQSFDIVQPNTEIVITVQGGLISDVVLPDGMKVVVKDYDSDGFSEDIETDKDGGGTFVRSEWG